MDKKIANKVMEESLKITSYIMIILATISLVDKLFISKDLPLITVIMLIMEVGSIISFIYSYYLFFKKRENGSLFIVLPLTVFFLYLTAITSYIYPVAAYGTISCIIMLLTIEIKPKTRAYLTTAAIITAFLIVTLQIFKLIPMEPVAKITSLKDSIGTVVVMLIFYSFIGLSLYIYHVRSLSRGSLEKVVRQYEDVLDFAIKRYNYTKREADVARCLIQGMTYNEISIKLDISLSTVKFHIRNLLEKSGFESKTGFYERLLDKYRPLTKVIKEVTK